MKIKRVAVASMNNVKFRAVSSVFVDILGVRPHQIEQVRVKSGVSEQPKSLDEIMQGAQNRARNAYNSDKFSLAVGIENGIVPAMMLASGYLELAHCAIYDGERFYSGQSSAFEVPRKVAALMLEKGYDMNRAVLEAGFSDDPELGKGEGIIGLLTNGRVDRTRQTIQAVEMALVPFGNRELYFG